MAEQVDALSPAGVAELANFIIRPPRATYDPVELGERSFTCEKVHCIREDVELQSMRGFKVLGSHFRPRDAAPDLPTVVYMHGNGSCRVEGTMLLHYVMPYGLAFFAFDFTGSGLSDGQYISLGVYEKYDVQAVVDHLVEDRGVQRIVLWGHSMGAATAVMYAGLCRRRPQVKGLVLDSPFASFEKLAHSMVSEMPLPIAVPRKLILTVGVRAVRKVVREKASFDVMDIDPLSAAKKITYQLPTLFLHGTADAVVPLNHGELLHKQFPSKEKQFITLRDSEHDSPRPEWAMDKVHMFLQKHLREYGVQDLQFLEQIKARGNAAMLAGRFRDANVLYTEALNALSENVVATKFAHAVGEPAQQTPHELNPDDDNTRKVSRKNSSITNLVSSVKRWRYAHSRGSEKAFSTRSGVTSRVHTDLSNDPKLSAQISTDILAVPSVSADFGLPDDRSSGRGGSTPSAPTEEFKHSMVSGDERTDTQSTQENPNSEELTSNERSGRTKRNWRARHWVQNLKNTILKHHKEFEEEVEDRSESVQLEASEVEDETQEDETQEDEIEETQQEELEPQPRLETKKKHSTRLFSREQKNDRQNKRSGVLFRKDERNQERRRPSGRLFQREQRTTGHLFYSEDRYGLGNRQQVGLFSKENRYSRDNNRYADPLYREDEYSYMPQRSSALFSREKLRVDDEKRPGRLFYRQHKRKKDGGRRHKSDHSQNERRRNGRRQPSDELQGSNDPGQSRDESVVRKNQREKAEQKQPGGKPSRENRREEGRRIGGGLFSRRQVQDTPVERENGILPSASDDRFERFSESSKPGDRPDQNALGGRLPSRGRLRRSQSSGKLSRSLSSGRINLRGRERKRDAARRERHLRSAENIQAQLSPSDSDDRIRNTDDIALSARNFMSGSQAKLTENGLRRSQTDGNIHLHEGISSWEMSEAQKTLALALLGNRSLARRKLHDNSGALFDSMVCLQLDPSWIRGYLRKAAALREDGKLEQARNCVLEGLREDPDHAGLIDMLQSIDLAVEAEQLAIERKQGISLDPNVNRPQVVVQA